MSKWRDGVDIHQDEETSGAGLGWKTRSLAFDLLGFFFFFFLINSYFIYLFIFGCVGSSFRARAFSSCGKQGPLFIAVHGPLTIAAPPVAGHRFQTRRLSSCGSRAQLLRGIWDLPRPGLEPVSPALAGRFSTTAPPGKPDLLVLRSLLYIQVETLSSALLDLPFARRGVSVLEL